MSSNRGVAYVAPGKVEVRSIEPVVFQSLLLKTLAPTLKVTFVRVKVEKDAPEGCDETALNWLSPDGVPVNS